MRQIVVGQLFNSSGFPNPVGNPLANLPGNIFLKFWIGDFLFVIFIA